MADVGIRDQVEPAPSPAMSAMPKSVSRPSTTNSRPTIWRPPNSHPSGF